MTNRTLLFLLGAAGLLAAPATVFAKIERHVTRTFDVAPGGTLVIHTDGGGIQVMPASGTKVGIEVVERIHADTDAEADTLLKNLSLTFDQTTAGVASTAKYEGSRLSSWLHSWPPVECEYIVTVPTAYSVDLHTSGGGIVVGDLTGHVAVHTSGGGLTFGRITGDVDGHTSGGAIHLEACTGNVDVVSSGGGIVTGPIQGRAHLHTSGGSIEVRDVAGPISADTSGGPIAVAISGPIAGDCEFSTSGGGITLHLDPQARFNLDAHTSGGRVHSALAAKFEGETSHGRMRGTVNGGGPTITLRSSGGGISIAAR